MDKKQRYELERFALQIRIGVAEEMKARGFGHIGGSLSVCDVLAVLYGGVMNIRPDDPTWAERDKLVCSKGHAGPSVYAALALKGYFPYEDIKTLNQPGTRFPSHCDRSKTPGVDMTTGSLGQGTSQAVGLALGDRLKGRSNRVFLIVGDGELNEGQSWEAAMFAASYRVNNLVWIIDENKRQLDGYTKDIINPFDLRAKFEAFGFEAVRAHGSDVGALYDALTRVAFDRPLAIVMDTIKGHGIAQVENTFANHSMNVGPETCDVWIQELHEEIRKLDQEVAK